METTIQRVCPRKYKELNEHDYKHNLTLKEGQDVQVQHRVRMIENIKTRWPI
jgi:hypothetical protein